MTYEEAATLKLKFEAEFELEEGRFGDVVITPLDYEECYNYLSDNYFCKINDENSKDYSSNNKFKVVAVIFENGSVMYKTL